MDITHIETIFGTKSYTFLKNLLNQLEINDYQPTKVTLSKLSKLSNISLTGIKEINKKFHNLNFYHYVNEGKTTTFTVSEEHLNTIKNYHDISFEEKYLLRAAKGIEVKEVNIKQELERIYTLLGYDINSPTSIHEQFMIKHNLT
jgi:hypothetical protein